MTTYFHDSLLDIFKRSSCEEKTGFRKYKNKVTAMLHKNNTEMHLLLFYNYYVYSLYNPSS